MMNIKSKGWRAGAGPDDEAAEKETPETTAETEIPETPAAEEIEIDEAAEEEMSEAYADLLRRAMEDAGDEKDEVKDTRSDQTATATPTPTAPGPSPSEEGPSQAGLMLRCGHIAAHVLALAAVFWVSFSASASLSAYSSAASVGTQLSTANSYLSGYAPVVAVLGLPAVLMAASLAGRPAGSARLALAAAAADLLLAAALASVGLAFAFPAPVVAALLFAALGACATVSAWKA